MHKLLTKLNPKTYEISIVSLSLGLGLCFFTFQITGFDLKYFPGDLGDARLNMYFLEHAFQYFTRKVSALWDVPFMYPEKNVLAFSDNLLGSAPIYSIFRLLGFDIYRSFQLWYITISALNYLAAYIFLKYLFKNDYAAILGAFVYGFSIALMSQLVHAQTYPRFPIPIAFLMALKFGENYNPKYFFLALLTLVYQIYCGIYLGFMLAIPLAIFLFFILNEARKDKQFRPRNKKWILSLLAGVIINLLILFPLMLPYFERRLKPSYEHFKIVSETIPMITSYFYSIEGSFLWPFLNKVGYSHPAWWEHQLFSGGIATMSILISFCWVLFHLIKPKKLNFIEKNHFYLILTGLITFLLFLNFDSFTAYTAFYYLPGYSSLRCISRIINIQLIFFALATSFVFSKLFSSNRKHKLLVFSCALGLIVFDNYFDKSYLKTTGLNAARSRITALDSTFSALPKASIVSYEPEKIIEPSFVYHLDAMLLAQKYGLKTLNAYTATSPLGYSFFWRNPNEENRMIWLKNFNLPNEAFYVVKSPLVVRKIFSQEMNISYKTKEEILIQQVIQSIKTDVNWMKAIEEKAIKRNISVDSMVYLDATWVLKNN